MKVSYDALKNQRNIAERDLPFDSALDFAFENAIYSQDNRRSYPEARIVAIGYLMGRLHVLCFTPTQDGIRVISFRKANYRERRSYEKTKYD